MKKKLHRNAFLGFAILFLGLSLNSCFQSDIHLREYLRPIRKLFNKERSYWTDKIEYRGNTGTEIVFYKNGRTAMERFFNASGQLETITYLGRNREPIRTDSLVYAGQEVIGGYYFSEPGHQLILRFLSYKRQGQLSQRSWFDGLGDLLSREFFLFDRNGYRRMRMIFDGNDSLLYTEHFKGRTDDLQLQNTYALSGEMLSQIRHSDDHLPIRYDFNKSGVVTRISQLHKDGSPSWSSELFYNKKGALERSSFSINNRFLFTYLGDLELRQQSLKTWKHPASPNQVERIFETSHRNPFIETHRKDTSGTNIIEYRLPLSETLFKHSTIDKSGYPLADTIYTSRKGQRPVSVITYREEGLIDKEITYDLGGNPKWRHTWFRDDDQRVIREELTALPDTFSAAVTRIYDSFGSPALSERFTSPDSFDGSWVFYRGGGINNTLFYNSLSELTESWLIRPSGDTTQHSKYQSIDYFRIQSKFGIGDTLLTQRRFTNDGLLNWELFFDGEGRLVSEIHRKKDGSVYREVSYDHEGKLINSFTYAPYDFASYTPGDPMKGELSSQVVTRLNAQGETVQLISKNSSGDVAWEKRHAYRKGRLLKSAQLGPDGKPVIISTYTHNERGQVLSEKAIDREGGEVHTVENHYDEEHQLVWKIFASEMTGITSSNRYYYDELGRVQRDEIIEAQRFIEAVEYQYFPEYYLRLATHMTPDGDILRKELENYFSENVFALAFQNSE